MKGLASHVADSARPGIKGSLDDARARLGQFMTPAPVAEFMASMIRTRRATIRLLDPGAGTGSLTAAAVERLLAAAIPPRLIRATCFEIDPLLCGHLEQTLTECERRCETMGVRFEADLRQVDYIAAQRDHRHCLSTSGQELYDLVIMNPPYRKINGTSRDRHQLRDLGIETSNLYSAFMLLATRQLSDGGEFISINPRSFCNGPYFRRFRLEFLDILDLRRVHVFESRKETFKDDAVLQENVVIYGRRQASQSPEVEVSSTQTGGRVQRRRVPVTDVRQPGDADAVIHLFTDDRSDAVAQRLSRLPETLASLGLTVSTGRVVDFRAREHLRQLPGTGTAPLIFPTHLRAGGICWPIHESRKPNAIAINAETSRLLIPKGYYVLIRRFSAKEERRRVVAAMYDPRRIPAEWVGFDNKTNYVHLNGKGLGIAIARGLTVYLNSTLLDEYFRTFSGHTQVNATDLRRLPLPAREQLVSISRSSKSLSNQEEVDRVIAGML